MLCEAKGDSCTRFQRSATANDMAKTYFTSGKLFRRQSITVASDQLCRV